MKCPCHSSKEYQECCFPYHHGTAAPNALLLMRSRYSAYALGHSAYIIKTTHPQHPDSSLSLLQRKKQIDTFSKNTEFRGLEILDFSETPPQATVTFRALLLQEGRDVSFTEKSEFALVDNHWLYLRPLSFIN